MATFTPTWDSIPQATTIAADAIADAANLVSDEITNEVKSGIMVKIVYGNPATEGAKVYLLPEISDGVFAAIADGNPIAEMEAAVGATRNAWFAIPPEMRKFKVGISNDSGASITATVNYQRQTGSSSA